MDTVPVEDNQVVAPDDSQVVQTQQQVPTIDLGGVVDSINDTKEDVNSVGAKLNDGINGVAGQVDELSRTTGDLVSEVRASNERNVQQTTTMLLDDAQWNELQQSWWLARDTFAAAFFLEIVIALLLASMLGAKLWEFFSKGWRR